MKPGRSLIADNLAARVRGGKYKLGQLLISPQEEGFEIRHLEDATRTDLLTHTNPAAARSIALHDDAGNYRPLKTAPNLKHGWRLSLKSADELRLAIDFLYPAQAGMFQAFEAGNLEAVPLRDTLSRQTGMYRITRMLNDDQAQELVATTCKSSEGCLRTILWPVADGVPLHSLPPEKLDPASASPGETPLLCAEACNILVAAARPIAKDNLPGKS